MILLDSLFPVFARFGLGAALRRLELTHPGFLETSDRLVYFIFFPAMLFWKIGGAGSGPSFDPGLVLAALAALVVVSIGGVLTGQGLYRHLRTCRVAAPIKLAVLPAVGFLFLTAFAVTGTALKVGMLYFALPTSTSIYVLSSQLNSDTRLASASIVISTALSFGSLSAAML